MITSPTRYHSQPHGSAGPCPICGFAGYGEHRAVDPGEAIEQQQYIRRVPRHRSPGNRQYHYVLITPAQKKRGGQPGPKAKTLAKIAKAAAMEAAGTPLANIARDVGLTLAGLADVKLKYGELWDAAFEEAARQLAQVVREAAGTTAMFTMPHYFRMGLVVQKRAADRAEPLFPRADDKLTLRCFYEEHYRAKIMAPDACEQYREQFLFVLRAWEIITADPPLDAITNDTLLVFRDALCQLESTIPGRRLSPNTVRTRMHYIQRLLDAAGPPTRQNRTALGIIPAVPWAKAPRALLRSPKVVALDLLGRAYQAADLMRVPIVDGIAPAAWWKAVLAVAYGTGLRRRTLFSLPMSAVDWDRRVLHVPPECLKARRGEVIRLNPTAFAHVARIRGERELLFPWTCGITHPLHAFTASFHRLQDLAGIARKDQFGLHTLRRTCASMLVRDSAAAAQLTLGHADFDTTRRHYICSEGFVAEALDNLPQPEAFCIA